MPKRRKTFCNLGVKIMKQLFSLLLSITLLFQGFNLGLIDLVRVGDMLHHLEYHSKTYGDSFTDFLSKHYGASKEEHHQKNKEEHPDHEQLPFQQQKSAQTALVFFIPQNKIPLLKLPVVKSRTLNFIYKESWSSYGNHEIFQPPRQV